MALMVLGSNVSFFLSLWDSIDSWNSRALTTRVLDHHKFRHFFEHKFYKFFDNIAFNTGSILKSILILNMFCFFWDRSHVWTEEILVAHHVRCHVQLFAKRYLFANRPHPWTFLPTDVNWMPLYGAGKVFLHLNVFKVCRIVFGFYGLQLP